MAAIARAVHATTLITNALIERKGARTGLLTTAGFRDILAIGRELRYDLYDLRIEMPAPLVPQDLRKEVQERVRSDGTVREPLDLESVRLSLRDLTEAGAESVAIVLLHSYANSEHEEAIERIVSDEFPDLFASASYRISREIREYERTSTTVANAYVQPRAVRYLTHLESRLREDGFRGPLSLMISSGGIASAAAARDRPITLTESGPAAGALVGGYFGQLAGEPNIIAFDMGGTTAKACLIDQGEPLLTYRFEAGRVHRFKKGSGLPLNVPAIDLIEIGAGGGSIAQIDRLGLLKVGPDSAGADPGPACYGRGGTDATVTDADLLLGYLNPDAFLGGDMSLDRDASQHAVERLGQRLGLDATGVAWGIHDIVNENMASAARIHIAERGRDPRRFALVATGGAGPVHADRVARKLRLSRVLCPLGAGVASTLGLLIAPPQCDLVHAYVTRLDAIDWQRLNGYFEQMREEATALSGAAWRRGRPDRISGQCRPPLRRARIRGRHPAPGRLRTTCRAPTRSPPRSSPPTARSMGGPFPDSRWRGSTGDCAPGDRPPAQSRFHALCALMAAQRMVSPLTGSRAAYFPELGGFTMTPVYDRYRLRPGDRFPGPAIVEERESTVVVGPSASFSIDAHRTLVIDLERWRQPCVSSIPSRWRSSGAG